MIINIRESHRKVDKPDQLAGLLGSYFKSIDPTDRDKEHFFVFHLDTRSKIKVFELVSVGTVNASLVHPREVFTRSIERRATGIVVAHNHPSGDPEPSDPDIHITRQLVSAGKILGIEVFDHIIYTPDSFYSFRAHGLI